MKKLIISMILALGCTSPRAKNLHMGDVVQFKFEGRNLFYSKSCKNIGTVRDMLDNGKHVKYIVEIQCAIKGNLERQFIWIDEESILDVLQIQN